MISGLAKKNLLVNRWKFLTIIDFLSGYLPDTITTWRNRNCRIDFYIRVASNIFNGLIRIWTGSDRIRFFLIWIRSTDHKCLIRSGFDGSDSDRIQSDQIIFGTLYTMSMMEFIRWYHIVICNVTISISYDFTSNTRL